MLNSIALCARALVKIGARPIVSFADGTAESEIAGLLYEPARDAVLSAYAWSFATQQAALTRLGAAPAADYQYAYQLPNDFLRALSAGSGSRGRGLRFRIFRDTLQTDAEEVTLTYIHRAPEELCPSYFDTVVIARLAAEFCIPLTENTSRADVVIRMAEQELARARQIDAQQDTPNRLERFTLIDARG
jgi:hypothetical protein